MGRLNENPLGIWNALKIELPKLHLIAYRHLAMVGTSVLSERLFSKDAQTVNQQRNRLKGSRLNKHLFLQSVPMLLEHFAKTEDLKGNWAIFPVSYWDFYFG